MVLEFDRSIFAVDLVAVNIIEIRSIDVAGDFTVVFDGKFSITFDQGVAGGFAHDIESDITVFNNFVAVVIVDQNFIIAVGNNCIVADIQEEIAVFTCCSTGKICIKVKIFDSCFRISINNNFNQIFAGFNAACIDRSIVVKFNLCGTFDTGKINVAVEITGYFENCFCRFVEVNIAGSSTCDNNVFAFGLSVGDNNISGKVFSIDNVFTCFSDGKFEFFTLSGAVTEIDAVQAAFEVDDFVGIVIHTGHKNNVISQTESVIIGNQDISLTGIGEDELICSIKIIAVHIISNDTAAFIFDSGIGQNNNIFL